MELLWTCCELVVQVVFLADRLAKISTILATLDNNFDICTINVVSVVAMLYLHTAVTACVIIQARIRH